MKFSPSFSCSAMGALILGCLLLRASISNAQLRPDFYFGTCPHVFDIIGNVIVDELASDPRIAASILRLHFHDCFVNVRTHSIYISIYTKELTCSWTKYFTYHFFFVTKLYIPFKCRTKGKRTCYINIYTQWSCIVLWFCRAVMHQSSWTIPHHSGLRKMLLQTQIQLEDLMS